MNLLRIKDLFHFEKGSLQSSKCVLGDYNFITAASEWKSHNEFSHNCEALIFAAAASGSLGRIHYVNGKFISSDLCFIITPKSPERIPVDLKFYHLLFDAIKEEIVRNTKAGTSKEAIGLKAFGNYKLPYFEITQQTKIREIFIKLQEDVRKLNSEFINQLDLVKQLRQSFLKEAMQGKIVSQDVNDELASLLLKKIQAEKNQLIKEGKIKKQKPIPPIKDKEIPFKIPENWVWCRLGDVLYDQVYGTSSKASLSGDIPVLRMGNITTDGKITYSNLKYVSKNIKDLPKLFLTKGDLVFNRTNSYELVGKCSVFYNEEPYTLASYLIRVRFGKLTSSRFFSYYINCSLCRETQIEPQIIQQNGQANFNGTKLANIIVPLPSLSEQKRIVAKLDELMNYCDQLEESIIESQDQNKHLLQQILREALEPKTKIAKGADKKREAKVIQFKPTNVDYYKRTVLASEIVWQLQKEPTLGHLKLQKLIYLCQRTANMNLPTNFLKQAMGPYDPQLMRSIDKQLKQKKWFQYSRTDYLKYVPLEKAGQHHTDFVKYFSEQQQNIQFIIDTFKNKKSDIIEITATLYACLEDMLNKNMIFSEALLIKMFYEWSEEKEKFKEDDIRRVFLAMKNRGIVPNNFKN